MSTYNFDEMQTVIGQTINPAIRKHLEDSKTLYERFIKPKHEHHWLDDMKSYARMLSNEIVITHSPCRNITKEFKISERALKGELLLTDCKICRRALLERYNYQLAISNDNELP